MNEITILESLRSYSLGLKIQSLLAALSTRHAPVWRSAPASAGGRCSDWASAGPPGGRPGCPGSRCWPRSPLRVRTTSGPPRPRASRPRSPGTHQCLAHEGPRQCSHGEPSLNTSCEHCSRNLYTGVLVWTLRPEANHEIPMTYINIFLFRMSHVSTLWHRWHFVGLV